MTEPTSPSRIRPGQHLERVRLSRRRRRCEECRGVIEAGTEYARLSLPPTAEFGSGRWWSIDIHIVCPEEHP